MNTSKTRPFASRSAASVMLAFLLASTVIFAQEGPAAWRQEWEHPSRTYRPRVRWGWPGNAITPEGIDADLHALAAKGFGGVEIVTYWQVFQEGNFAPLSPRWFELVRHTLATAHNLDMDVALSFTEAGWSFGGDWVAPEDRNKVLVRS